MANQQITWQVTNQEPAQEFPTNGNPVTGKRITFTTSTGYSGTVFVPDPVYAQPDQVKEIIANEVRRVVAIHTLTGTVSA